MGWGGVGALTLADVVGGEQLLQRPRRPALDARPEWERLVRGQHEGVVAGAQRGIRDQLHPAHARHVQAEALAPRAAATAVRHRSEQREEVEQGRWQDLHPSRTAHAGR
eukprot:COSAG04_NODE_251_length_18828_cov_18.990923_6_plen_109_part_00